jgi:hypothetical protein
MLLVLLCLSNGGGSVDCRLQFGTTMAMMARIILVGTLVDADGFR